MTSVHRHAYLPAVALVSALLLALSMVVPGQTAAQAQESTTITVLHDSHFHGNFADDESDIARYFALAEERMADAEHALFLGNGDDIAPSLLSGLFQGDHMIDALNASPMDYNTFGNHEFDYGPDKLRELVEATETFTWVSANVRDSQTDDVFAEELGAKLFDIREMGGVNVGITGLGPRDMATITSMGDAAYELDYVDAMDEVIPQMQEAGADIIIVTSHLCSDDAIDLAEQVDGIDLIVGDHCATAIDEPLVVNGTIVNFAGDQFEFLDEIDLHIVDGQVDGFDHVRHVLSEVVPDPHPEIQAIVDNYNDQLDDELNVVIGERTVEWDARVPIVRHRETAVGNYLTDIYAEGLDADIGLQNGGGIRGDRIYEVGEITRRQILEMLPFENYMVVKEVPGDRVLDLLDASVEEGDGVRMQFSGIEMVFDPSLPDGERVLEATMGCEPIDPDTTYRVATIDYLAEGGSGMEGILSDLPYAPGYGPNEAPLNSTYVMDYLEDVQDGPVTTDVDGRLYEVDADYEQPDPLCAEDTADTHDLTLLATTEVHTNLMPWDYYNDTRSEEIGLAKTATLIEEARAQHDDTLLFDTGDILQGAIIGEYVATIDPLEPGETHPAIAAMNVLDYDALTLGNHEFDFGIDFLDQILSDASFPAISANVFKVDDQGEMTEPLVDPYVIIDTVVDGVPLKAGVIGITPPGIMTWHAGRLEGRVNTIPAIDALERYLPEMEAAGVDLTILSAHAGKRLELGGDAEINPEGENWLWFAAERFQDELDAIVFGHEQSVFPGDSKYDGVAGLDNEQGTIHGVPAVMAGAFGSHLGKVHLELTHDAGEWTVVDGWSENVAVTEETAEHAGVVDAVAEHHQATIDYVRSPVGTTDVPITHYFSRVMDTKAVELVNDAQIWWGEQQLAGTEHADLPVLAAAAPFRAGRSGPEEYTYIPPGEVSVRELADLYIYPNMAHIVRLNGAEVIDWLEKSGENFNQIDPDASGEQELVSGIEPFNFDVIDGIEYQYDVTQPLGERVVSATFEGEPLDASMQFAVVTNNYRAGGGGDFPHLDGSRTILATDEANRAILVQYVTEIGNITEDADGNWSILPVDVAGPVYFLSSPEGAEHIEDVGLTGVAFREVRDDGWGVYDYLFETTAAGLNPPSCDGVEVARFPDVPSSYVHADSIGCVATLGIMFGWPNGEFRPTLDLTRAQASSILVRALEASGIELTDDGGDFTDIAGNTHESAIRKLAATGIVVGKSETRFAPDASVTRGQIATMVDRASTQLMAAYPSVDGPRFTDTAGSPHADAIDSLNAAGIAHGYDGQHFGPQDAVLRAQSASFIARWLSDQAERLG